MVRSTDQEDSCGKHSLSGGRSTRGPAVPSGEALGCVGGSRSEGERGQEPLLWFRPEGTREAACAGLGMTSLSNVGGLGEGAVPGRQIDTGLCRDKGWVQ